MVYIRDTNIKQQNKTAVTLGNFDGLHIGHQKLIDAVLGYKSNGYNTVVFSFYPHPAAVIKEENINVILTRSEKYQLIKKRGIDIFIEYPFTKAFSMITPEVFIKDILVQELRCKVLVIGDGYRFGKNKAGDADYLQKVGELYGIQTIIVPHCMFGKDKVSSSHIRNFISVGDLEKANMLLGRNFSVSGNVISGNKLGRTMGFPTVNLLPDGEKILPPNGVYATVTCHNDWGKKKSITNIGIRPTVGGKVKVIETHIFGFKENLYDSHIEVAFHKFIRPEKKFESINQLKAQIEFDKKITVKYFNRTELI